MSPTCPCGYRQGRGDRNFKFVTRGPDEYGETEDAGEKRMVGGYSRGIPGVVSGRIQVHREEVSEE